MKAKKYYSKVTEILDDMDGANYMITDAQIKGIRDLLQIIRNEYRNNMRSILARAYEAGRADDEFGYEQIYLKICNGAYDSEKI